MPPEPMSLDTFVALVLLAAIGGAVILYYASKVYFWFMNWRLDVSSVSDEGREAYVAPAPAPAQQTAADPRPSVSPSAVRAPSAPVAAAIEALTLDRSRMAVVLVLVAHGWNTAEIRKRLTGANDEIGEEVKAARIALGLDAERPPVTPYAGRPYDPALYPEELAEAH